jgi:signal peptidase II
MTDPDTTGRANPKPPRLAIKSPAAIVLFVLLAAAGVADDLLSKHYAFKWLLNDPALNSQLAAHQAASQHTVTNREALHLFKRPVGLGVKLTLSTNPGVVFGLMLPRWGVAVATVLTVALVVVFFATADARAFVVHIALALILAGALGNLYDRCFSEVVVGGFEAIRYEVRDFLDFSAWGYPWIFNVADAYLVIGAALLLISWFRTGRKAAPATGDAGRQNNK